MSTPSPFQLQSPFAPTGDQPAAIEALDRGLKDGRRYQILEGVTGSGKTFTVANVIERYGRPALVVSHKREDQFDACDWCGWHSLRWMPRRVPLCA